MDLYAGKTLHFMIGKPDAPHIHVSGQSVDVILGMRAPTVQEKNAFAEAKRVMLSIARIDHITFLALKVGAMQWMDMPYHPLATVSRLDKPDIRYALQIALVDTQNGLVLALAHTAGLPERLSAELYQCALLDASAGFFNRFAYSADLTNAMMRHQTEDVARCGVAGETSCAVDVCESDSPVRPSLRGLAYGPCLHPEMVPENLRAFAVYLPELGDCVLAIPQAMRTASKADPYLYEVPVPLSMVLRRAYQIETGHVYMDIPYDPVFGLLDD